MLATLFSVGEDGRCFHFAYVLVDILILDLST
jgi:hypothetical protein